jgi:hypothetical protein
MTDINAFVDGINREKHNIEKSIEMMLEYEGNIEAKRVRLSQLGVNTIRVRPYGKVEYIMPMQ